MEKKKHNSLKFTGNTVVYLLITALFLIVVYPFVIALFASFKSTVEILTSPDVLPHEWLYSNYVQAWNLANFSRYTMNSIWYSAWFVAITVFTSAINGYAFSRGEFRGKNLIFGMFSGMMFIALGSSSLYPTLQLLKVLHLNKSLNGLLIKQFFAINIADMYIVRGYINSLPKALDEAATIDGCNFIQIFFKVHLPILKPALATVAILSFAVAWNDYLMPMIVTMGNSNAQPLSVGLQALKNASEASTAWNLIMAGAMISAVPMLIVYMIFNKYFIKGLAAGAVKG